MKLAKWVVVAAVILQFSACGVLHRTNAESQYAKQPGGDEKDLRPRAINMSMYRGSSETGVLPSIEFRIVCHGSMACPTDFEGVVATLRDRVQIVDLKSGTNATTLLAKGPSTGEEHDKMTGEVSAGPPRPEYSIAMTPSSALEVDHWYALRLVSDSAMVLGSIDDTQDEQLAVLSAVPASGRESRTATVPFFTGSAPTITRLRIPGQVKGPSSYVHVRFSEPVLLGMLANGGMAVTLPGGSLQGCPWDAENGKCADPQNDRLAAEVEFVTAVFAAGPGLKGLTVDAAGTVRGRGRTLAAGADATGESQRGSSSWKAGRLFVTAEEWHECGGEMYCYHVVMP